MPPRVSKVSLLHSEGQPGTLPRAAALSFPGQEAWAIVGLPALASHPQPHCSLPLWLFLGMRVNLVDVILHLGPKQTFLICMDVEILLGSLKHKHTELYHFYKK